MFFTREFFDEIVATDQEAVRLNTITDNLRAKEQQLRDDLNKIMISIQLHSEAVSQRVDEVYRQKVLTQGFYQESYAPTNITIIDLAKFLYGKDWFDAAFQIVNINDLKSLHTNVNGVIYVPPVVFDPLTFCNVEEIITKKVYDPSSHDNRYYHRIDVIHAVQWWANYIKDLSGIKAIEHGVAKTIEYVVAEIGANHVITIYIRDTSDHEHSYTFNLGIANPYFIGSPLLETEH